MNIYGFAGLALAALLWVVFLYTRNTGPQAEMLMRSPVGKLSSLVKPIRLMNVNGIIGISMFVSIACMFALSNPIEGFEDVILRIVCLVLGSLWFGFMMYVFVGYTHEDHEISVPTGLGWIVNSIIAGLASVGATMIAMGFLGSDYMNGMNFIVPDVMMRASVGFVVLMNVYFYAIRLTKTATYFENTASLLVGLTFAGGITAFAVVSSGNASSSDMDAVFRVLAVYVGTFLFGIMIGTFMLYTHDDGSIPTGAGWFVNSILAYLGSWGVLFVAGGFLGMEKMDALYDIPVAVNWIAAAFIVLWNGWFYAVRLVAMKSNVSTSEQAIGEV